MEVEEATSPPVLSQTLESFEDYIGVYLQFIPEKVRIEKRLAEIKEFGKTKRVKNDMPRFPERVRFITCIS